MNPSLVQVSAALAAILCLILGTFAYLKNPQHPANRSFFLFNLTLAAWNMSEMAVFLNFPMALYVYRLAYIGGSFIAFAFLTFMCSAIDYPSPRVTIAVKWFSVVFSFLSATPLVIKNIQFNWADSTPIEEIHGPIYPIFIVFFISSIAYGLVPLFRQYKAALVQKRTQFQYIIVAIFFGLIALSVFFANQAFPIVPPLHYVFQIFISASFAIAILKHRLMDISIIIRKTLVYSVVISILTSVYLLIIAVFTHLSEDIIGRQPFYSSAIAAALITLFFQPLRKKVQSFVDRKFFRQYVDREEKLYELSREVITHTTPEAMGNALQQVLMETFHPKRGALYVRSKDGSGFSAVTKWGVFEDKVIDENNALAHYFLDHPQPFLQDLSAQTGTPRDTREPDARGRSI